MGIACNFSVKENGGLFGARLFTFKELDSTNKWAISKISSLRHGDIILAISQTAGVGRFGRKWLSPGARCLTLSLILDPSEPLSFLNEHATRLTAIAVLQTMKKHGITAQLKWPNDVLVAGRKICGILAEQSGSGLIVLGIGLNVNMTPLQLKDPAIGYPATSMLEQTKRRRDPLAIVSDIKSALDDTIQMVQARGLAFIHTVWSVADYLSDRTITLQTAEGSFTGRYDGISESGAIILKMDDKGRRFIAHAGDVIIKDLYNA